MNGKSSAELEREAESVRAEVSRTAESLRERMTPGQLVDQAMDYLRHSDTAISLNTLKTQVRDNPLALAVSAAGLAWLMMGPRTSHADNGGEHASHSSWSGGWSGFRSPFGGRRSSGGWDRHDSEERWRGGMSDSGFGDSMRDAASGAGHSMHETASGVGERMRSAASGTGETMRNAASGAWETAGNMRDSISEGMSHAGHTTARAGRAARHQASSMAGGVQHTFGSVLEREPLILGALGLAIGAAIGAMLPSTRFEDETFGEQGDRLRRGAKNAMREGFEGAKDVAKEAYRSGAEAADEEGLVPEDGKPLAEKVSATVAAGAEAAKAKAAEKMGGSSDSSGRNQASSEGPSGRGSQGESAGTRSGTTAGRAQSGGSGTGEKIASTPKEPPRPGSSDPVTTDEAGHTTSSSSEGPARTSPFPPRT